MSRIVTHLIIGLGKGGAETMLYQVLKYQSDASITHKVISLGASHYYEPHIKELGIDLVECNLRKNPITAIWRTYRALKHTDTLCCWMYHANFIGYLLAKTRGVKKIVWCIRHSNLDPSLNKKFTLQINNFCAKHSSKVSSIAYNGNLARVIHESIGYCKEKSIVLDNGCDTEIYAPFPEAKAMLQNELNLSENKNIIVSVTKYNPIKDVPTFIKAFADLLKIEPNCVAVMCGMGIEPTNYMLANCCNENGLTIGRDIFLLGLRHDVPTLLAACDLYVLHSASEAFPNALIQAMSSRCLCVATDVGDARRILEHNNSVIPARNVEALTEKMLEMIEAEADKTNEIRTQNRERVLQCFDIHHIVKNYEELF